MSTDQTFPQPRVASFPGVDEVHSPAVDSFSVTRGGLLYRLELRLGGVSESRTRVRRAAIFATLIAWVPLLLLSSAQGLAYGHAVRIPFLRDIAGNVRFLVALPILILSAAGIDRRWRLLVGEFIRSGLLRKPQLPSYEAMLNRIVRLRDRALPEVLIAIAAYLPSLLFANSEFLIGGASNWHTLPMGVGKISWAGWWFKLVSEPVFRFLILRWAWWMFLWVCFLRRVSQFDLFLVPTHTDKAAGLGFLAEGQKRFSPIIFAGGAVVAAQVANAIAYEGSTLSAMKWVLIGYGVLAVLFLVAPLLILTPLLIRTKKNAILEYGGLVTKHNQLFHSKWIESREAPEALMSHPDAASLANLGKSFEVVRDMSVVPVDRSTLITLAVAAALPMLPMVIFATGASELLRILLKMLG